MALFNELVWQHRRKHSKAWLFFTALLSMMLISYAVIFVLVVSAQQQQDRLILEQIQFFIRHIITEDHQDTEVLNNIDAKGRNYAIVIFSPSDQINAYSNTSQTSYTAAANWQVYRQKTDITLQTIGKIEAVRVLPDGYRVYVYLASPYFYYRFMSPINLLPLLGFLLITAAYRFFVNRQTRAWQSLLEYCHALPHYIVNDYQPYRVTNRSFDLDIAQMEQVINRFGFQLYRYFHELKALSQHQQQLIENMPISLFILNRKGRISYFNQQFSKDFMTPFYPDALYLLSDFVAGKDKVNQQRLSNLTGTHTAVDIAVTDLQHQHFFDLHLQPVYNHLGKVAGFSGCLQNVSQYQNELQVAWLNEKKQQDKLASFDKLWAVLGHELRTPLSGMVGMIEILDEEKLSFDTEHQEVIHTLQQSAHGMLQMLNDMLDIAKLGAGKLNTNIAQVDLFALMRQVAELMVGNARRQQIDLLYHIDGQIPRYIETDDGRLRQILLNLLSNAIKFTQQGYVALLADLLDNTDPIIVKNNLSQNPAQKWLRIMVKDTGMGISESEQKKLFSFFNQANETISRQFGGTGLGLAISNSFSQLLGGFIHLHSEVDKGSEFQVYLPLKHYVPQVNFTFNPNQYPFHLILIVKYAISQTYVQKLLTILKVNFTIYIDLTSDNITELNHQFNNNNSHGHLPLFIVDDHCYENHNTLFEQINCFERSPKIYLTMNPERSSPSTVLEKFDGILTKPTTMNNFLAEITRVYDKFQQQHSESYVPVSAQAAYEQFLVKVSKIKTLEIQKSVNSKNARVIDTQPDSNPAKPVTENNATTATFGTSANVPPNNLPTNTAQPLVPDLSQNLVELSSQKKSILVAEDNPVNQKIVQRHLTKLGYTVILAENGQQAIDMLGVHRTQIGLILMDCHMPVLDGFEATRLIRAQQNSIPIIALTANHTEDDKQLCLNAGMDNFLTKPLNKLDLITLLNRYRI